MSARPTGLPVQPADGFGDPLQIGKHYAFGILPAGVVPVTAGPGDQDAADAVACGYLRASHAHREHVIDTLKTAFVQGMLAKDEFELRVSEAFASRTCAELAALTAGTDTDARRLLAHSRTQRTRRSVPAHRASAGLCT